MKFAKNICQMASKKGVKLKLEETADGWSWAWSNGFDGETTARTKAVALLFACEHYLDL